MAASALAAASRTGPVPGAAERASATSSSRIHSPCSITVRRVPRSPGSAGPAPTVSAAAASAAAASCQEATPGERAHSASAR